MELDREHIALKWRQARPDRKAGETTGYFGKPQSLDPRARAAAETMTLSMIKGVKKGTKLSLADLSLHVLRREGEPYVVDTTCDGSWMRTFLEDELGPAIRRAMHWVPRTQVIRLQMDNAGGHGKKSDIDYYISMLKSKFNIQVVFQPPNSPETNVLDLGIWRSMQAQVDALARSTRQNLDALDATCQNAWHCYDDLCCGETMERVWEKLAKESLARDERRQRGPRGRGPRGARARQGPARRPRHLRRPGRRPRVLLLRVRGGGPLARRLARVGR